MLGSVLYHAIEFIGIEQAFTPPSPNLPAARIGGTLSSPSLTPFLQMISFCFRNCCRWCSTSKKLGKLSYSSCVSLIDQSSSAIMIAQRVSEVRKKGGEIIRPRGDMSGGKHDVDIREFDWRGLRAEEFDHIPQRFLFCHDCNVKVMDSLFNK